ncbi:SAM-dependent methyltransferase [uncultured Tateyamaria sp.]|uniref:class I SAM-dependent methyltransferase n=1 Tax=uncultured Tateyamaria sp. TaxID=455651 RepID=UPI002637174A|nr:SAM-dependent methyltransferase [uncultured Tateyamaria sp.]
MSLGPDLIARITAQGPISVAEFMAQALLHPTKGYYVTRDPLGAGGDFTTAPEISQMFGELVGLSLAQAWLDQGAPAPFVLAELGPGRGTLMADILRATAGVPGFAQVAQVALVEASPVLRDAQAEALAGHSPLWVDTVDALPPGPLFVVANEFFDALPVRQFQRAGDAWRERSVGVSEGALTFGWSPVGPQPALAHRIEDTAEGDIVEHCPMATAIAHQLGARIAQDGGAALIIDYGDWRSLGDTLQAVRDHAPVNPLEAPGAADLTTHVDFEALAQAAAPASHTRLTPQGVFLERLGITDRARALAAKLEAGPLEAHIAAHRRLTHPAEMGNLFKVLGIYPGAAAPPPGLLP